MGFAGRLPSSQTHRLAGIRYRRHHTRPNVRAQQRLLAQINPRSLHQRAVSAMLHTVMAPAPMRGLICAEPAGAG
ncbi:hypothetical protein FXW78_49895 [Rhodococcus opacus]|nr:hypothetical protein [Rhodococcus opacus]